MRKQHKPDQRQEKIDQIIGLMTGKLTLADISPCMVIHFNKEYGNTYLINKKPVDRARFDDLLSTLPAIGSLVTHGREDNNEEYYYGDIPFSIYKDGTTFKKIADENQA